MTKADRALVIQEFQSSLYPGGVPDLENAWLGISQVLQSYSIPTPLVAEKYGIPERGLLRVHDEPALFENRTWRDEARRRESELAQILGIQADVVPGVVDRMMRLPRWLGKQPHNPKGNGFRMLLAHVLTTWGSQAFEYLEEQDATQWFPGISMPGRSATPFIDVLAVRKSDRLPIAVISCKWGFRHDRVSDPTNECIAYRSAATQQSRHDLFRYYVFTSETYGRRLDKLLNQPCISGLIHTRLEWVCGGLTPEMHAARQLGVGREVHDLVEFVRTTHKWPAS